jgi:hypothetical protein
MSNDTSRETTTHQGLPPAAVSLSVDWYHEGEGRIIESAGIQFTVRFVGRKGRRARIAIIAPAGAAFKALDPNANGQLPISV